VISCGVDDLVSRLLMNCNISFHTHSFQLDRKSSRKRVKRKETRWKRQWPVWKCCQNSQKGLEKNRFFSQKICNPAQIRNRCFTKCSMTMKRVVVVCKFHHEGTGGKYWLRGYVLSVHVVISILVINGACDVASRITWKGSMSHTSHTTRRH
jgi:hypothetical protein